MHGATSLQFPAATCVLIYITVSAPDARCIVWCKLWVNYLVVAEACTAHLSVTIYDQDLATGDAHGKGMVVLTIRGNMGNQCSLCTERIIPNVFTELRSKLHRTTQNLSTHPLSIFFLWMWLRMHLELQLQWEGEELVAM
jgi:hypothetical protein